MTDILQSLIEIVGEKAVSNRAEELWFYARDPGVLEPHTPAYVVAPKTTEEVQRIVDLANRERIPVVPISSTLPSQSSSWPSQYSLAPGFVAESVSSQSVLSAT